jgi:hypothetical protein
LNAAGQIKRRIQQVQQYLDSTAKAKVDQHYIEVPEKPWRVILRYKSNGIAVNYDQKLDFPETNEHSEWKLSFEPPMASSVGFWVGYRGTGLSYYYSLNKNAGRYFSLSSTGAKYGLAFRLRRFNVTKATFGAVDFVNGQKSGEYEQSGNMPSPVWIRSAYLNGYYVFNGRRYSQDAAYNQSVIQRRSAGSFLLGATWYQSSFDYSDMKNCSFMILGRGIHRIKVHQANIGFGYGYNFVPFRGLVINAMTMPTLSVYNRVKIEKYDFNYELTTEPDPVDDYGKWDPQTRTWANGKSKKPITMATGENDVLDYWDLDSEVDYSALHFNVDLRLGITYNWKNCYLGFQAQFNNFTYKKDDSKVTLTEGYAEMSLGVRL